MTVGPTSNLTSMVLSMQRATTSSSGAGGEASPTDARVKTALAALESLTRPASDAAEERKAAAAKKVEALKARIKMLRMSGGDPGATAKAVAALARELGAAVKAYAAAGGSAVSLGVQTATSPTAEASGTERQGAAPAEVEVVPTEASTETGEEEEATASPTDPYRQTIERMQQDAADRARRNSSREADTKFAAEVKGLAAELKAILREAQNKARREDDPVSTTDEQAADKALSQVADAVADIGGASGGMALTVGVSISI